MKTLVLLSALMLGACASNHPLATHEPVPDSQTEAEAEAGAMLLVSLADGQLVMQHVNVDADVCMKSNADPETRCFKRGEPIYAMDSATIVAYHLETQDLNLRGK